MKRLLLILSTLFLVNCGSSDLPTEKAAKIKTFKNKNIEAKYPKTWIKFGGLDYVYFMPKKVRDNNFENEVEHVSINKNNIQINSFNQIENVLNKHGNTLTRNQIKKSFELVKLNSQAKFIYKIESFITYNSSPNTYKRVEYFYQNQGMLKYFIYQMREELFDLYHEDALFIINSVHNKK